MEVSTLKFAWKIKNFSTLPDRIIYSDIFFLGPYKWKMSAYPKGSQPGEYLSVYLLIASSETLPSGWSLKAKSSFTLVDQIDNESSFTKSEDREYEYKENCVSWGYGLFMSLEELYDPKKGYLVEDTCIIKVDVTLYGEDYLKSVVASKQTNKMNDLEKNATEKDIDAFFGDLNSVVLPKEVVSMEEEAIEALSIIEEALSMVPVDVNNPGRLSQLTNAFDILSSLDDCSIVTTEQKENLLSMKDNFIALPERASIAGKNIKLFAEKELVKKTLNQKLGRCRVEFEKTKLETKRSEQNIATLQKRVDSFLTQIRETKKERENLLSKQKEMFRVSMELKAELDALVKNWPEYEEKMKVAEKEEKIVWNGIK